MNREMSPLATASTEDMSALRSPGLAETLPPSNLLNAGVLPSSVDHSTVAIGRLNKISALVEKDIQRSITAPLTNPVTPASTATPEPTEHPDEEPLESYLDSLMERLTGKKAGAEAAPSGTQPINVVPVPVSSLRKPGEASQSIQPPLPILPAPQREPAKAPECRATMAAMRELAIQNARHAVAQHASSYLSGKARLMLAAATGSSLVSSGLAAAAIMLDVRWCLWGATIAACAAFVCAIRFFGLCRQYGVERGACRTA